MTGNEDEPSDLEQKLSITTEKASRGKMLGRFEWNLSTKLAIALFVPDPLLSIRHSLEAFLSLSREEREVVEPDEEARKGHGMRYDIVVSLLNMRPTNPYPSGEPRILIPWSFAPNSNKDGQTFPYFELIGGPGGGIAWTTDDWNPKVVELIRAREPGTMKVYFDWLCKATSRGYGAEVCLALKSQFVTNNMPVVERLSRSIMDHFIDPNVFEKALEAVRGRSTGGLKGGDTRIP